MARYICHGATAYGRGEGPEGSPQWDPPLAAAGEEAIRKEFEELVKLYGAPQAMVTSSYLACRQTADIAAEVILRLTDKVVPNPTNVKADKHLCLMISSEIGEYLGAQERRFLAKDDFDTETWRYRPVPPETWEQFQGRVQRHLTKAEENTWYITHEAFIKCVNEQHNAASGIAPI